MRSTAHRRLAGVLAGLAWAAYAAAGAEPAPPAIAFLEKEQAQAAIIDDALEKYFDQLQPMEMAAKTGAPVAGATLQEQRAQCRQRYQAGVAVFTEAERTAIRWHVAKLIPVLLKDYPLIGRMPWSFLKVSDQIEGGLPHTRGRHIILPASLCQQIVLTQQEPAAAMAYLGILDLLAHEQMHVFQRIYPAFCDSLYTGLWGFQKAEAITACPWLLEHHLANPDAVACPWILPVKKGTATAYLWPLVVFSEGNDVKQMPDDFRMLAISLRKTTQGFAVEVAADGKPAAQDLLLVPEVRALFPLTSSSYHPNEASADLFGKLVVFDAFMAKASMPPANKQAIDKHLGPLRKWFQENCRDPTHSAHGRSKTAPLHD